MKPRILFLTIALSALGGLSLYAQDTTKKEVVKRKQRPLEITLVNDSSDTIWIIDGSQIGESMRTLVSEPFLKELNKQIATSIRAGKQVRLPKPHEKETVLFVYTPQKVNKNNKTERFYKHFKIEEKEKKARSANNHIIMSLSTIELLARGKINDRLNAQFKVTDYSMKSPLLFIDDED